MDLERVAAMHVESIRRSCKGHYTQAQIEAWTGALQPSVYEPALTDKCFIVALNRKDVIGLGIMSVNDRKISAVYVHPDHCGKGIGGRILAELEHMAASENIAEITAYATLNAKGFYLKNKYKEYEPAVHSLPNGLQLECIEMRKHITRATDR